MTVVCVPYSLDSGVGILVSNRNKESTFLAGGRDPRGAQGRASLIFLLPTTMIFAPKCTVAMVVPIRNKLTFGSMNEMLDPRDLKTALFCISFLRKGEVLACVVRIHNLKDLKDLMCLSSQAGVTPAELKGVMPSISHPKEYALVTAVLKFADVVERVADQVMRRTENNHLQGYEPRPWILLDYKPRVSKPQTKV